MSAATRAPDDTPRSWMTPRFFVACTARQVTMRRRRPWWDAATTCTYAFYATAIASGTLAWLDPMAPLLGITFSAVGFVVAGMVRAERRASKPFARIVRSTLVAGRSRREAGYRGDGETPRTLVVDGAPLDAEQIRSVVVGTRAIPQRYGAARTLFLVSIVLPRGIVQVDRFDDDEHAARRLAHALCDALGIERTASTLDETYAGGCGSVLLLVMLIVVEVVLAIVLPMIMILPLGKSPSMHASFVAGLWAALPVVLFDAVASFVGAAAMRAGVRRHFARTFGIDA